MKQPQKSKSVAVAYGVTTRASNPTFKGAGASTISVSRRELVGTVSNGSNVSGFYVAPLSKAVPGYDLSITSGILFPWGSQVGFAFEKFRFRKLKFELVPSQATTTAGRVYMAVDPDWSDDVPDLKQRVMGYMISVNAPVWESVHLNVPCSVINSTVDWRFCSPSTRTAEVEPRMAYAGFLVIGYDTPVANCLWDLWVDYEVDLMSPTSEDLGPATVSQTFTGPTATFIQGNGTNCRWYPGVLPAPAPPLEIVTPAEARIPSIETGSGQPRTNIVKLPPAAPLRGAIDFLVTGSKSTATPVSFLDKAMSVDADVFDSNGTLLGLLSSISGQKNIWSGPNVPTNSGVNGSTIDTGFTLPVKVLKDAFPEAASLAPFLKTTEGLILDTITAAITALL